MSRLITLGIDLDDLISPLDRSSLKMLECIADHFDLVSEAAAGGDRQALAVLQSAGTLYMGAGRYVADVMAKGAEASPPTPPWPIGPGTNCKRYGWDAFFSGKARNACPFPPDRRDLKQGYEEGWDRAKEWKTTHA